MNLLLLTPQDLLENGERARISGRRAAHLIDILGVEVGATVEAGLLGGRIGRGTVVGIERDSVDLELRLDRDPPPRFDVRLVLALPRPKNLSRTLQGCSAMGIRSIHLIRTRRVEKSYWSSPVLKPERIALDLHMGAEQGRDTILPEVRLHTRFRPFVDEHLHRIAEDTLRLVGDLEADVVCPAAVTQPVTLIVGPEGGLIPYEVDSLRDAGFEPVRLGSRALRVEQAVPAFLGRLMSGSA